METFKVTLTVIEPFVVQGLYQVDSEDDIHTELIPRMEEQYGKGNVKLESIEPATDEEKQIVADAIANQKKSYN